MTADRPLRMLVCGTNFGRFYIEAVRAHPRYVLAGILARGSAPSRALADRCGVPLYSAVEALPEGGVDVACVVVGSAISGGAGTELAGELMGRGIHVLQEHPVHLDELTQCLRLARRHGVQYRLNTHYPHVEPVRAFIEAARRLAATGRPLFVDAATPVHLMHPMVDILGRALGTLRPWRIAAPAPVPPEIGSHPFRTVQGVLGGVPLTLRVHHQLDPTDRDNHALHWHRVSIGAEGGVLTLADTHGPILWSPRLHVERDADHRFALEGPGTQGLDLPTTSVIGGTGTFRSMFDALWPQAIGRALAGLAGAVDAAADPLASAQYDLSVCRIWSELAAVLGPPEVIRGTPSRPLAVGELFPGASVGEPDGRSQPGRAKTAAPEPAGPHPYTPSAEFFDLVAGPHTATGSAPAVVRALAGTDTSHGPVVDIGAGTGLITEAVALALPDAEILACEPSTGMRAVLTSRVFGDERLRSRVTVTDGAAPDLELPDRISAVVLCGMLGHLDATQRERLWARLAERLSPRGSIIVELMGLATPVTLPEARMATAEAGRHRYEWWLSGTPDPDDPAAMCLHSRWRVHQAGEQNGDAPLREIHDSHRWVTFDLDLLAKESGFRVTPLDTRQGAPPMAVLTPFPESSPRSASPHLTRSNP